MVSIDDRRHKYIYPEVKIIKNLLNKNGIHIIEDKFGKIFIKSQSNIGVVMLANDNGQLILINQYREPIESYTIQLPGGGVNQDEDIEFAARRELKEETGIDCGRVYYLGNILPASWRSNEVTHVYYTDEILSYSKQQLEGHEEIEVIRMNIQDCIDGIKENRLNDSELCYGILQAILKGFINLPEMR